ncbi:hypothetical protein [Acidovorax sp. SUPP3334]|uniref:hypothetical protein n=1 Tax=Acidovorax sp. SUPP3334 TaxID=2920881 RepID=UPI0023DE5B80|nr:hypothetical protein [Acidovorax sp. SUPP3334]GKT21842.1 hypothetical protein AVHM3334_06265 [Acidovorax sp. SUPP3334]
MNDIHQIRKSLLWGVPLYLGLIAGAYLLTAHEILPTIEAITSQAPVVRIAPSLQLIPFIGIACILGILVASTRAIPLSDKTIKRFERAFIAAVAVCVAAMVLIPVTSVLQRVYMPRNGYSICTELKDNPTLWFTDWVRDPAWCVKGKSMDWVNEQASTPHVKP